MGRNDIQVVPTPNKELKDWWNGMNELNRTYVKARIGYLVDLIYIEHHVPLIQALAQFWERNTASFDINENELTPTLEEYQMMIGVKFEDRLVQPPVGRDPLTIAEFLDFRADKIEQIMVKHMGRIPLTFLVDRYADKPNEKENMSGKVFILAFFGFVLFPCSKTAMDPVLACIAQQSCLGWDYSNMILAETIMSLNQYQVNQDEVSSLWKKKIKTCFKGSTGMLYLWFIGHIKQYLLLTRLVQIDEFTHPLGKFRLTHVEVPQFDFYRWCRFIRALTPDQIHWRISWPRIDQVRLTSAEGNMVPLLGFNGGTAYCPLRVVRQYGMLQEIPPPWTTEPFEFKIEHRAMADLEKMDHQAKVDKMVRALKGPRQAVIWPEVLDDEMELYRASPDYIAFEKAQAKANEENWEPSRFTRAALAGERQKGEGSSRDPKDARSKTKKSRHG